MFDLFKDVITKPEVIEESVVEDNTEALTIAAQLRVEMPSIGDTVRITEDSVFDAGKIGIVKKMEDNITIETGDGYVVAESAQVERLINKDDLLDSSLDLAFTSLYENVLEGLISNNVDENILENEKVLDSIHGFVAENAYVQVTQADFANLVVNHLLSHFPKLSKGVVEEPKQYTMLQGK